MSIDCGAIVDGWHGDAAFTMGVGTIDADAQRLIDVADRRPRRGGRGDATAAVISAMSVRRSKRWSTPPGTAARATTAATGSAGRCTRIPTSRTAAGVARARGCEPGVVLAIEPMLIAGGHDDVMVLDDDWTVVTADGSLAAHTEHTVLVTDHGPEILTRL